MRSCAAEESRAELEGRTVDDTQEAKSASPRRVGPVMRALADFVSAMPGSSVRAALRGIDHPDAGRGHQRPVQRAESAGLIIVDRDNRWVPTGHYALFASQRDRALFNLRAELLHGDPSPARAEEVMAEVNELRAEQAQSWLAS